MKRWLLLIAAWASLAQAGTVRHFLWDANQRPLYQRCATAFEAAHPGTRIRIEHQGWDDYWTTLSTGFISDTAPDVFTNHILKHPDFVANGVLVNLSPLIARDRVAVDRFEPGLLPMWQHKGRQYAMPTDWDTIAFAVNLDHARRMGVGLDELRRLTWNPRDGGSLQPLLARLTVDEAGRPATDPAFDRRRVKVWGYLNPGDGNMMGQTEWSHYAASAGFRFQREPWDPDLRYGDPVLADTLQWLAGLGAAGLAPTPQQMGRLGADALFVNGRGAIVPSGTWMIGHFLRHAKFAHTWVALPVGPSGQRTSMRNGLALSIWAGSPRREEAWQWVRHVASRECQQILAESGVLYPAWQGLAAMAVAKQQAMGVDTQVFLDAAAGVTFPPPVAPHGAEVSDLMSATIQRILAGRVKAAEVLPDTERRVRQITRRP